MADRMRHADGPAVAHKVFPHIPNRPAPGASFYTPDQKPSAGTVLGDHSTKLFQPLRIRGLTLPNRIILSPLSQYSAGPDGCLTDWHQAHLGGIISRGPGLSFVEGTAVTPQGRKTPEDSGLWQDSQIEPLRRIVDFAHSQGQLIGIQLSHAGRKASTVTPWVDGESTASAVVGGWPEDVWGPSTLAYSERYPDPKAYTLDAIDELKRAWASSVLRALKAGFDAIEIHSAYGFLFHQFLSPVSNKRTDVYGGSFENRTRLLLEFVDLTRALIPESMPLFVRISATDWLEDEDYPSWNIKESVKLAKELTKRGVDVLDVVSGGLSADQKIERNKVDPALSSNGVAYQAPFSHEIKQAVGDRLLVTATGGIKNGKVAEEQLQLGLDLVVAGRWFLKNPGLVFSFADDLDVDVKMPHQMQWAFAGRGHRGTDTAK